MSAADHRVGGLRPAKDVRKLHGEDKGLAVLTGGSECDFQAGLRVKTKYGRNEGK